MGAAAVKNRGHQMFVKSEERPYITADLIRTASFTAPQQVDPAGRGAARCRLHPV
jgi:hypothetical protein